jgi:hypothetical protein
MTLNPWIVEFAIRDEQEAERRTQQRVDRQGGIAPVTSPPSLAHRCLRASGQLLVTVGEALERFGRADGWQPIVGREAVTR